ncbi:hypothetical protein [Haliangium sp. UPWRP_2]|uniref:hypothetical protein n=1 Tax=Haliangium sp. UPWRP_2 TaxID=1931276 RepID=UPI000B544E9A|nr:hypothetical protein [Haliangium sp. UPWRP_2]
MNAPVRTPQYGFRPPTTSATGFPSLWMGYQLPTSPNNISDSTFDGSGSFGAPPRGPFTATNDVYVYHGASCSPLHAGANGPGDYTSHIPSDAVQLLSAPLSGGAGVQAVQTIDPLLPGLSNGLPLYRSFSGITLNPGDCLVTLYGIQGSSAGFDNEDQLHLIVQPD